MTQYIDRYEAYDSPLLDQSAHGIYQYEGHDPIRQIQIRMVVVFGIALMVASVLSLLALPDQIGTGSAAAQSPQVAVTNQAGILDQPPVEQLAVPASSEGIAPLFTPEVQYWENEILAWASQHDVDPNAVATIMQIESCGNPQAESIAGAQGLFQVMPFHFTANENMQDPDTNARRGLDFLNEQLRYTGGDIFLSFAGYNGGYAASGGSYENWASETQRYYQWAKGIYTDASTGSATSDTLDAWLDAGGRPGCAIAAGNLGM